MGVEPVVENGGGEVEVDEESAEGERGDGEGGGECGEDGEGNGDE